MADGEDVLRGNWEGMCRGIGGRVIGGAREGRVIMGEGGESVSDECGSGVGKREGNGCAYWSIKWVGAIPAVPLRGIARR